MDNELLSLPKNFLYTQNCVCIIYGTKLSISHDNQTNFRVWTPRFLIFLYNYKTIMVIYNEKLVKFINLHHYLRDLWVWFALIKNMEKKNFFIKIWKKVDYNYYCGIEHFWRMNWLTSKSKILLNIYKKWLKLA